MIESRAPSVSRQSWTASAIFNVALLFIPFIAAYLVSISFSGAPYLGTPTPETLAETRREIDQSFELTSDRGADARENWAKLIESELEIGNMSAVRGFLLAAPNLLPVSDSRAIYAAADEVEAGSQDQRMLMASLIFLPSDIRIKYEAALQPTIIEPATLDNSTSELESYEVAEVAAIGTTDVSTSIANLTHTPSFFVLGTVEDLVSRSRDWMRGNHQRAFELRLTGIAMASPPSATGLEQAQLIDAASILKTAWRSKRLHPTYARQLDQKMTLALPDDTLAVHLEEALADVAALEVRARQVQDAFAASIDQTATHRLGPELAAIAEIAEQTSPRGVLKILESIESPTDLQRAQLLARAGGDRAVALISILGPEALHISRGGIKWSRTMVFAIIGLTLAVLLLLLSALSVIYRAIFSRSDYDPLLY